MKAWKLYFLIVILSLFPLIAIFLHPGEIPHTSDGLVQIVRFAAFYKELVAGQFPVRWASQFDYGYGTPIFIFFNPLPYAIGALLIVLKIPLLLTLQISLALTYIFSGVFMLLFTKAYFKDTKTAFFVAIMYQYAPFRLVEMLVRGNLGSTYSYMLLPLVFYAITCFIQTKQYRFFALLSFAVALLAISHTIIGFVFCCVVFFYILFATKSIRTIIFLYASILIGAAVSGFFIIPAILEHKYTNGYLFTKDLFYHHFPKLYTLFVPNITDAPQLRTAEVSVQIGLFHVIAFIVLIFLLIKKNLQDNEKRLAYFIMIVSLITLLFIQPITKPLWENIAFIREFQFPWRLLAIICFTSALASSFLLKITFLRKNVFYVILTVLVIISTVFYWAPYEGYQKFSPDFFWNYPESTNYFAEVNTIWMEHEPTAFPKKRIDIISGDGTITNLKLLPEHHTFTVIAKTPLVILDNTYFFPGWNVRVDNNSVSIQFQDAHHRGLITFFVPQGEHQIAITYNENSIEKVGDIVSIAALFFLFIGIFLYPKMQRHETPKK